MTFAIPILVEERPEPETRLRSFVVRPLFHTQPVQRADRLGRALNKLTRSLRDTLTELGRHPRHDALAEWTFNPPLAETTLGLRLELKSGSLKVCLFFAGYAALDRTLYFTPLLPDLHFEVRPGASLEERATAVLTRHLRDREKEGPLNLAAFARAGRMRLTTLEIELRTAALAKLPPSPAQTLIFGESEKKDGEVELRKTGRLLQSLYPDDLAPAVGREAEVEELTRLLAAPDRRPVLLVGPRKVGKTAIVHEMVRRICARPSRPAAGRDIWLLSPMRLISGMSFLGEWENRVLAILDHAQAKDRVLYFDDLLGLFTAGLTCNSNLNVAQVLKPALTKRTVRVLAEITPESWRVLRERDRSFADLFHVLPVREPTEPETLRVLVNVARQLEEHSSCRFALGVVPTVFDLMRRFGGDAAFPGKAAEFLRRLAARSESDHVDVPRAISEFQAQSGLHPAFLNHEPGVACRQIVEQLRADVAGQDHALGAFAEVMVKLKARLHDPRRPLGTFLLLGPTGVGKTQAAKALARYLFSHPDRLVRFDMNEYVDAASVARLAGTPSEPDGLLTSAIRRQPFSVVLLDEIEKAAPEVFDLLLAVLDEGRLTDAWGRVADFTQAIILLTSNLGAREARSHLGFAAGDAGAAMDEVYVSAAEKFFRPEFFNRLDRVIPFRSLAPAHLENIARRLIADLFKREGLRRRECLLDVRPAAMRRLVNLGYHPQLGARALKRVIEQEVAQPLAQRLATLPPGTPTMVTFDAVADQFVLRLLDLRPVPRRVSWGDTVTAPRSKPEQRQWSETLLDGARTFLRRIKRDLDATAPTGRFEAGHVPPTEARYYLLREQWEMVERLTHGAELSLRSPRRGPVPLHLPKLPPLIEQDRQYGNPVTRRGRWREALALKSDLADLEEEEATNPPDSPCLALLQEAALLEAMSAQPSEDQPAAVILRAVNDVDAAALNHLARIYTSGLAGVCGVSAAPLSPAPPKPAGRKRPAPVPRNPWVQAVWCEGINLARLLPDGPGCVLVRRADGTLGIILISLRRADSPEQLQAALAAEHEPSRDNPPAAPDSIGPAIHLLEAQKTLTDFRSGLMIPVVPSPEEARAFVLGALPLPAELPF